MSRLAASIAPSALPAPTTRCSSSMKRMIRPSAAVTSFRTALSRSSNSPRNLVPATKAPMSRAIDLAVLEALGDVARDDPLGQPLDDGRLADARLADQDRVVLGPPREDLDDPADLRIAADDRVHLARSAASTRSLLRRGEAYEWMGDLARSRRDYEAALAEARMAANYAAEWHALMHLSIAWGSGAHMEGRAYAEHALTLARAMDDHAATAHSLNRLGNFALFSDQPSEAQRYHEQALAIFQSFGDARGIAETLERLGYARYFGADFVGGTRDLHEALDRYTKLDDRRGMVYCLVGLSERGTTLWTNWMVPMTAQVVDALPEGEHAYQLSRESGWPFGESTV